MRRPHPGVSPFVSNLTEPVDPPTAEQVAVVRALLADNDADDLAEMLGVDG